MPRKKNSFNVRTMTMVAFLLALGSVLHWAEGYIPSFVPGFRLGLANLPSLFALFYLGPWYYLGLNVAKVLLVALLGGGFGTSFLLALGGLLLSNLVTLLLYFFTKSSIYGLSIGGSVMHVLGQIIVYIFIVQTPYMLLYFPILAVLGMATGAVIAFLDKRLIIAVPAKEVFLTGNKRRN